MQVAWRVFALQSHEFLYRTVNSSRAEQYLGKSQPKYDLTILGMQKAKEEKAGGFYSSKTQTQVM